MIKMPLIEIENVSFSYLSLTSKSIKNVVLSRKPYVFHELKVLHDVSFSIYPGERVGIIGRNGSGKSTLLKLMSGIFPPWRGKIASRGSVSAVHNLGAVFNPELTAYENVELYMSICFENAGNVEEVLNWAGLGNKSQEKLRTFSSGMNARLAFSCATSQRIDLLLVDEALSVGDVEFQTKSIKRLDSCLTEDSSLVYVSHDLRMIEEMCTRVIWLHEGVIVRDGEASSTIQNYLDFIY